MFLSYDISDLFKRYMGLTGHGGGCRASYRMATFFTKAIEQRNRGKRCSKIHWQSRMQTFFSWHGHGGQTIEMDLARLVTSGLVAMEMAQSISAYPNEIQAQVSTLRAQAQAQATAAAGQGATSGSGVRSDGSDEPSEGAADDEAGEPAGEPTGDVPPPPPTNEAGEPAEPAGAS